MGFLLIYRQFDLRSPESSQSNARNVIVNLNAHMGHSAEAKCLAINPLRPEYLAVGANDPYIRMYDRRMLVCRSLKLPQETTNRLQLYLRRSLFLKCLVFHLGCSILNRRGVL